MDAESAKVSSREMEAIQRRKSPTVRTPSGRTPFRVRFQEKRNVGPAALSSSSSASGSSTEPSETRQPRSAPPRYLRNANSETSFATRRTVSQILSSSRSMLLHRSRSKNLEFQHRSHAPASQARPGEGASRAKREIHDSEKESKKGSEKSNKQRRSRSLVGQKSSRKRNSSAHISTRLSKLYSPTKARASKKSSHDSDSVRVRSRLGIDGQRSAAVGSRQYPRTSAREACSNSQGKSSVGSSLDERSVQRNIELAMAMPEKSTIEEMMRLTSNCSGSDGEALSVKGILSSLIAIENEES